MRKANAASTTGKPQTENEDDIIGVIKIGHNQYIHLLDKNTNTTRIEIGPASFIKQQNEQIVKPASDLIKLPPNNYCIVKNPVVKDADGNLVKSEYDEVKVRFEELEIRTASDYPDPFPLYPYEELYQDVRSFVFLKDNEALILTATRPFLDERDGKVQRFVGDEYLFKGPGTYIPKVEETIKSRIEAIIVLPNHAILLKAKRDTVDSLGQTRKAGSSWLHRKTGYFMPTADIEVIDIRQGYVLNEFTALHIKALKNFTDAHDQVRRAGEEWLVDKQITDVHIIDAHEELLQEKKIIVLTQNQYCIIRNPLGKDGKLQYGQQELRRGETKFFLQPGEELYEGIKNIIVIHEDEALLLKAKVKYHDRKTDTDYKAGQTWMLKGPIDFIPDNEVQVVEKRKASPLAENEGIYVRDLWTGEVKLVKGPQTYLLKEFEELWNKELSPEVEKLVGLNSSGIDYIPATVDSKGDVEYVYKQVPERKNKSIAVSYKAPHNSAIQLFDYKNKKSRIVFGPELIMLEPYEEFSLITLSGGQPKVENQIKTLSLILGPDFMTDIIQVETSDHAKLFLRLSYRWSFKVDKENEEQCRNLFSVKDFVGDACKRISSRIRGAVSAVTFDNFHKNSTEVIQNAIHKKDELGNFLPFLVKANNLQITQVDIQSIDPVEEETRKSLQKSVNMAFEIQTRSQEAAAQHQALRLQQEANGMIQRLEIQSEIQNEIVNKQFLELKAENSSVQSTGLALANAKARAEAEQIKAQTEVDQAKFLVDSQRIKEETELELIKMKYDDEIKMKQDLLEIEINSKRQLVNIEIDQFKKTVDAIGASTIVEMARAGPETQAKLLKGLGLQGYMIVDGKHSLNLMGTASGLLGGNQ